MTGQTGNQQPKASVMKLSKTLLAAMLTGMTLQTVQSCTKDKDDPPSKEDKKDKDDEEGKKPKPFPYNCPACGMG
jgi:hypothetical protein